MKKSKKLKIESLYYIAHKDNLESILKKGIFSHRKAKNINKKSIYDDSIINIRKEKKLPCGEDLIDYANLYLQPKNAMLYRVLHDAGEGELLKGVDDIVILQINKEVLDISKKKYIATQNAATYQAEFCEDVEKGIKKLDKIIFDNNVWWNDLSNGKAKVMAEFLVKENIPPNHILAIYTASEILKSNLEKKFSNINIVLDRIKFFLPNKTIPINNKITLVEGDMFFSGAQTITISVNTVGVMGKGLASRARYQFPDVYVEYQDVCRSKKLAMGKPCLIKREKSLDEVLAYDQESLKNKNSFKWFLLFATKKHWREDSDFEGIEKGLKWLVKNYQREGIESLALPALGCGLGNLSWQKLGPLMCKYLNQMKIKTRIYLPMEKLPPENQLTESFLLEKENSLF